MATRSEQVAAFLSKNQRKDFCANCIAAALPQESEGQRARAQTNHIRLLARTLAISSDFSEGAGLCCRCKKRVTVFWAV